jgi:hypothetical protein
MDEACCSRSGTTEAGYAAWRKSSWFELRVSRLRYDDRCMIVTNPEIYHGSARYLFAARTNSVIHDPTPVQ